jgi:hypothetical protein
MFAAESDQLHPDRTFAARNALTRNVAAISVTAVLEPLSLMTWFGPLAELAPLELILEDVARRGERAACDVAKRLPQTVSCTYHVVRSWRDAIHRFSGFDVVVVLAPPRRWFDRRLLRDATSGSACAVVRLP